MIPVRTPGAFRAWLRRRRRAEPVDVRPIVTDVRKRGDAAVREWSRRFDRMDPDPIEVPAKMLDRSLRDIPAVVRRALETAAANIAAFAEAQLEPLRSRTVETMPGVTCGQRVTPLARVGVYAPGGRYPLPSSVLMGVVPARVAGVPDISVCTPPGTGMPDPVMLAAARIAGAHRVYRVGGAQAIAALAYGTESIAPVDRIVGPGNRYVDAAKRMTAGAVGIDLPAGPSELMVIADATANPEWVAWDLLAQAEHDPEAVCVLISDDASWMAAVTARLAQALQQVRTAPVACRSLADHGMAVWVRDLDEAVALADAMAPEHLSVQGTRAVALADRLAAFGTLFIGGRSAVAFGDYGAGVNHVLPTGGAARFAAGLSVLDMVRLQTTVTVSATGLDRLAPAVEALAEVEGLAGHRASVVARRRTGEFR